MGGHPPPRRRPPALCAPPPPPAPTRIVRPPSWDLAWARDDYLRDRIDLAEFERRAGLAVKAGA